MQVLQEEVKKDIIKHATRTIEIIYEPGKTTKTAQDAQLLDAYIQLHDFEQEMGKTADELFHDFIPVGKTIDELCKELIKVKATFDHCCSLADKLSDANYVFAETSLEKLIQERERTEEELKVYNEKILKLYGTLEGLYKKLNEYNEANETKLDAIYTEYNSIKSAHSSNWESNAINIVTFEDESEKFYSFRTVMEKRREGLIDFCENAVKDYETLNLKTTTLYNVWNEFVKRCDLLRALSDLQNNATGFTNN